MNNLRNKINQIKQKLISFKTHAFYLFLIVSFALIYYIGLPATYKAIGDILGIPSQEYNQITGALAALNPADAPRELTMEEWIMAEVKRAGLKEKEAWAIISCESKWNEKAFNINNNKTGDFGIWQINQIHFNKDFNIQDALNFKSATKWAIEKRLHDKNWSSWVCAKLIF